jgi:hypothetical protein
VTRPIIRHEAEHALRDGYQWCEAQRSCLCDHRAGAILADDATIRTVARVCGLSNPSLLLDLTLLMFIRASSGVMMHTLFIRFLTEGDRVRGFYE